MREHGLGLQERHGAGSEAGSPGPARPRDGPGRCSEHGRLRALEHSGAISGYRAHLDAKALGLTFEAAVFVTMRAADRDTIHAFEEAVEAVPNILQAQRLFGDPDDLLRVIAPDLPAFQQLYDDVIAALLGVQRLSSPSS